MEGIVKVKTTIENVCLKSSHYKGTNFVTRHFRKRRGQSEEGYGEEGTREKEEDLCPEVLAHPSLRTTFQGLGYELYPTLTIVCTEKAGSSRE